VNRGRVIDLTAATPWDGPAARMTVRLDELVRKGLAAKGDPREVVADEQARYSGARVSERTLVPGPDAPARGDHLRQVARQQ
jgi:hypothetical protein